MATVPEYVTVERPGGTWLEVREPPHPEVDHGEQRLFGMVRVTEQGWVAHDLHGHTYGPFATMGEAAYPLALTGEGHDARMLLGKPIPPGDLERRPAPVVAPPAPRPNPALSFAFLLIGLAAILARLRAARRSRRRGAVRRV